MWTCPERSARRALLALGAAAFLWAACSQEGTSIRDRRRLAEEETRAALLGLPPLGGQEDPVTPGVDESLLLAYGGAQEADLGEDDLEDLEDPEDPEEPERPALHGRGAGDAGEGRRPRAPARDGRDTGAILGELREAKKIRQAEARFHAEQGRAAYSQGRFEEARDSLRKALDLDPSLLEARELLDEVLVQLGERAGEAGAMGRRFVQEERVRREQRTIEVRRNVDLARKAFAEGAVDRAEALASQALEMMQQDEVTFSEDRIDEVRRLLGEIRRHKSAQAERVRQAKQREALERAAGELDEQERRRQAQVQDLLRKAARFIRMKDYEKAAQTCESVLALDPRNKVALFWHRSSQEQLLKERKLKVVTDRLENRELLAEDFVEATTPYEEVFVFPDDYGERIRGREATWQTLEFTDPEPIRNIKRALEATRIRDLSFQETPLSEVVATFRQIAGVNIIVNPQVQADEIRVTQPINDLPAMSALKLILEAHGLAYTFEENIMVINSKGETRVPTVFEVYNASDLLTKIRDFAAPEIRLASGTEQGEAPISFTDTFAEEEEALSADDLIQLIKDSTGGDEAWVEGSDIQFNRGQLFVDAPRELHQKLVNVLANLRQDSDLFVVIEARFIEIHDDFLEDIGLDARALGVVNNLGSAFGGVINDSSTGGNDLGIVQQGDLDDVNLSLGLDRWAGRVQHIIDGFAGTVTGQRVNAGSGVGGGTFQATWLEPFQVNTILRVVQEKNDIRQLTAPVITAHNNERVYVSVITQRAYIADYELVSGGTGFSIIEVADPVVQTFQEGVILDVDPTISHDKKYVTLDVRPTLATLIGGVISTIEISLGSFLQVAFQVPIGIPQISLQQSFTSVTVPNGGTVLLGGFKSLNERQFHSYLPILGKIPILKNLARRKATVREKTSLVILLTARIVDLRGEEARQFNRT